MKKIIIILVMVFGLYGTASAQVSTTIDILPDTNSTDSTAILNNNLRQTQSAINAIGGYFNPNNGALNVANGGTGAVTLTGILLGNGSNPITGIALPADATKFLNGTGAFSTPPYPTDANTSNVLFQYQANTSSSDSSANGGEILTNSLVPTTVASPGLYRFLRLDTGSGTTYLINTKWKKFSGVNTITVYAQIWSRITSGTSAKFAINVGGIAGIVAGTVDQITPEWVTLTLDVSGLSNGTVYDVQIGLNSDPTPGSQYLGTVISFGS